MTTDELSSRATLSRSIRLFRLFLHEQDAPDRFYRAFATDSVQMLSAVTDLSGQVVLDVGGGPGYFARAFDDAGASYVAVELDVAVDLPSGSHAVQGSGTDLPIRSGSVDIAYCSNSLEHVADGWAMASELLRVTRSGGLVFLSFTPWFGPWGGHETAPWHYLGGRRASRWFTRRHGRPPKNDFGRTLFAYKVADALEWASSRQDADLVVAFPRYHPRWAWWSLRVPVLRELVTWNLALVLRKR